jgi:hypothetical protein
MNLAASPQVMTDYLRPQNFLATKAPTTATPNKLIVAGSGTRVATPGNGPPFGGMPASAGAVTSAKSKPVPTSVPIRLNILTPLLVDIMVETVPRKKERARTGYLGPQNFLATNAPTTATPNKLIVAGSGTRVMPASAGPVTSARSKPVPTTVPIRLNIFYASWSRSWLRVRKNRAAKKEGEITGG